MKNLHLWKLASFLLLKYPRKGHGMTAYLPGRVLDSWQATWQRDIYCANSIMYVIIMDRHYMSACAAVLLWCSSFAPDFNRRKGLGLSICQQMGW